MVVVDNRRRILGYITIYDVIREFENESALVKDIMKPFPHIIDSTMLLNDAIQLLDQGTLSYLPVVNERKVLTGLLTRGSVVGHLKDAYPFDGSRGA